MNTPVPIQPGNARSQAPVALPNGGGHLRELELAYIAPELREDQGEFAAAEHGRIPLLIEWTDLRGSLHNHSNWSDGRNSLAEIAAYVEELGLQYWAITDHSKSSFVANGLDPARLRNSSRRSKP